jgi:hypothetical protein
VDVLREPVALAVRGYLYYEMYPHRVPTFRRGTWLQRMAPDTKVPGSIPDDGISCNPSTIVARLISRDNIVSRIVAETTDEEIPFVVIYDVVGNTTICNVRKTRNL